MPNNDPGDGLLHPVALLALALLVLNDHVLKGIAPSPLTGILSGFAGIVILPLTLQAGWELLLSCRGRWLGPAGRPMMLACVVAGFGYAGVEVLPPVTEAYEHVLGALQWIPAATLALLGQGPVPRLVPVMTVSDPWDLLALSALVVPWQLGIERARAARVLGRPGSTNALPQETLPSG